MYMNFNILKKKTQNLALLYIEDDPKVRDATIEIFQDLFKQVDSAVDGKEGIAFYEKHFSQTKRYHDIVISDIQMPILNGIDTSKVILELNKEQIIIITSAYDDKEYLIELINMNIDKFMQKPLTPKKIFSTLSAVCQKFDQVEYITLGESFFFDNRLKLLIYQSKIIHLTKNELNLIDLFVNNPNQIFSPMDILNYIYYNNPEKEFSNNAVKSMIKRLRKKIPINIFASHQSIGYSLELP